MSLEVVQIAMPGGGNAYAIRHIHPKTHATEAESLLRLRTAKSRLEDRSEPVPQDKPPECFFVGMGLDWASPLTPIDLYVELPFWLLAPAGTYPVSVKGTTLEINVLQDWVESVRGHRYTSSHCNAIGYGKLTDEMIDALEKQNQGTVSYRTLRTTLHIRTRALQDAVAAYSDPAPRRGQLSVHYLQALACAHVPFVNRLVNAYQIVSGDPFAFEVGESDLPFWFAETGGQWIGIPLMPYDTFDQYPYIRDFSGTRSHFGFAEADSLCAALTEEPFPGHIELLDAWSLYYRGKFSEAIRFLATAVEIALEHVFRRFLLGKGQSDEQIAKRLELTFNNFDGRLEDYLRASDRRLPGPILSIIPYINGVRYHEELGRNRRLRHKVLHEGRRLDTSMAGDIQRAMETTTWLFRWLVRNEEKPPKLRGDLNPLLSSLRIRTLYTWSYTPEGVLIDDPSKRFEAEGIGGAPPFVIDGELPRQRFVTCVDGEHQDLELFVRMFFGYIGLGCEDAPHSPPSAVCEYERYLVYCREAGRLIPVFLFDLDGLPTSAQLHAVAARLLTRGNMPDRGAKAICVFNFQKGAPWRLREDSFADDAFFSLAQQCGISICSTVDMLLVIDAAKRLGWACRPIEDAVFQPGRTLAGPPGYELIGAVNKYYETPKALSVAVAAGADLRKGDTIVVRLKHRYHEQLVNSLAHDKQQVQVVVGPANAGVGADLDRSDVFEDERGRVFVNSRSRQKKRCVTEPVEKSQADEATMVQGNTLYCLALAKAQAGDPDGASADYEALLALSDVPGALRAAALFDRALMKSKAGDRAGALTDYSALLATPYIHPHQYAKALLNRGVERSEAGDTNGALTDFDLLISLADAPSDQRAKAYFNRASLNSSAGNLDAAMADLDAVLGIPGLPTEKRVRALFTRGTARAESGYRAGAISDFDTVLASADVSSELRAQTLLWRGAEKRWAGDRTGALADFDAILALSDLAPSFWADALINRGAEKLESGDRQGSLNDFDAVLAMPTLSAGHRLVALMQRAGVKVEAGESAGALADYEAILALPDLPAEQETQVFYYRALTKSEVGDWTGALADFDVVLNSAELSPGFRASALFNRARAKQRTGDSAGALADYEAIPALPDLSAGLRSEALSEMYLAKGE